MSFVHVPCSMSLAGLECAGLDTAHPMAVVEMISLICPGTVRDGQTG